MHGEACWQNAQEVRPLFGNHFATVAVEGVVKRDYTDYPRWQVMNTGKIGVRKDKQGNRIYFALIHYELLPYKKQEQVSPLQIFKNTIGYKPSKFTISLFRFA